MADEKSSKPNPFDVKTIEKLVALMSEHEMSEINLRQGEVRIQLRRGGKPVVAASAPAAAQAPAASSASVEAPAAESKPKSNLVEIKSPTPGTFYAQEKPEADPYVKVGSKVTPETVVGQIEAMKLYTEITADCTGVIAEIVVENAQAVGYGDVLFRVDPTG